ncbi:MAG: hypothetical protein ACFFAS_06970 [Promethearchaeota archaeon]
MGKKKEIKKSLGCNVPDMDLALDNINSYEDCEKLYLQDIEYIPSNCVCEEQSDIKHDITKIFSEISFKKDGRNALKCVALDEEHLKERAIDYSHCEKVRIKQKKNPLS